MVATRPRKRVMAAPCDGTNARGRHGMIVLIATVFGCSASSEPPPVTELPSGLEGIVVEDVGLDAPVSVVHDAADDVYLVVNAGRAGEAPFISRLSPDGTVEDLRWVDGTADGVPLRTPRGIAIRGDTLYVADGGCIQLFQRASGAAAGSVCPAGAVALNDAAVDLRGRMYFSDASRGVVHVMDGGNISEAASDPALERNGGLSAGARGVFVSSGGVYQLRPDGLYTVIRDRGRRLGGIVFTRDGSFAFTNESDSTVIFVEAIENGTRGAVWMLASDIPSAGDLGYDARRERILIPESDRNRLVFISLKPPDIAATRR